MYYHYTTFETFLRILQGIKLVGKEPMLHLHATRIDKVNDPTEMSIKKETLLRLIQHYEQKKNVSQVFRIADKIKDMSQSEINHIIKSEKGEHPPYVACFSKKRDYLPMWSLYGDKHHGVCMCFSDGITKIKNGAILIYGDVAYSLRKESDSVNSGLDIHYMFPNTRQEGIKSIVSDILSCISPFIKNGNYSYEREFRLCVYNYQEEEEFSVRYVSTDDFISLPVPVSSLKQVILGSKVPLKITEQLLQKFFDKEHYEIDIIPSRIPYQ